MNWRALLVSVTMGMTACGGDKVLPPVTPAPVAACLTLLVKEEKPRVNVYDRDVQKAVRTSFEEAMVGAGFNVLADPALPHDLVAHLEVDPGSRVETGVQVRARLVLEREATVIDKLDVEVPREAAGYETTMADLLVDALFRSPHLAAFTRTMRNPKSGQRLAAAALRIALAPGPSATAAPTTSGSPALEPTPAQTPPPATTAFLAGPPQPAAFAFIVGADQNKSGKVPAARADAERFAEVARRTLGVPDSHVKVVVGDKADKLAFDLTLEWLKLNVPSGGRVYFFFSGMGSIRRGSVVEYLIPYDADPAALDKTAVPVLSLLQALAQTRANEVLVFLDAGFSGVGPRSLPLAESKVRPGQKDMDIPPRIVVMSASAVPEAPGDTADRSTGLFTRYLTEGLGNARADFDGDGKITANELLSWMTPRIAREARRQNHSQTPRLSIGVRTGPSSQISIASGLPAE